MRCISCGIMVKIDTLAPEFRTMAYHKDEFREVSLSDYRDRFVVLFFYPADFTFVCPTELEDMADNYEKFKEQGVEILAISTDTHFTHKAWHDISKRIQKVKFPILADPQHTISKAYEVLQENEGIAFRATFVIDEKGIIKFIEINCDSVGRNSSELLRKITALKTTKENPNLVCPAKWNLGGDTLKPDIKRVGKL